MIPAFQGRAVNLRGKKRISPDWLSASIETLGGFKDFLCSSCSSLFGEDSHFDSYFQWGWNHQLEHNWVFILNVCDYITLRELTNLLQFGTNVKMMFPSPGGICHPSLEAILNECYYSCFNRHKENHYSIAHTLHVWNMYIYIRLAYYLWQMKVHILHSGLLITCWCLYRDSRISGESGKLNLLPQGLVLPLIWKNKLMHRNDSTWVRCSQKSFVCLMITTNSNDMICNDIYIIICIYIYLYLLQVPRMGVYIWGGILYMLHSGNLN